MTMRIARPALVALALLVALGACGRKGPLELPPGATPPPARAEAERPVQPIDADENVPERRPIDAEALHPDLQEVTPHSLRGNN